MPVTATSILIEIAQPAARHDIDQAIFGEVAPIHAPK